MIGLRVIAGQARGRGLRALRGLKLRPTAERAREALFDILGAEVSGAVVLDLYAGTGSLGIEALSRGAARATFVEADRHGAALIRQNLARCRFTGQVLTQEVGRVLAGLARRGVSFTLVFLDPPYGSGEVARALRRLGRGGLVAPGGLVVAEHAEGHVLDETYGELGLVDRRRYGRTCLSFFRRVGSRDQ